MKRLFWALDAQAPWPHHYPKGRLIKETMRHITLAFLGNVNPTPLMKHLDQLPPLPFQIGPVGRFEQLLFLPEKSPRVIATKIHWLTLGNEIESYHWELTHWLESLGYRLQHRAYLPHLTIARAPFYPEEWGKVFAALPVMTRGLRLYESRGNLQYQTLWEHSFLLPFEEFEHTADIAFHIVGHNYCDLLIHAAIALAFKFPSVLPFLRAGQDLSKIEQVIHALNEMIALCDTSIGCPFKAVSHHGKLQKKEPLLHWEMVVDV